MSKSGRFLRWGPRFQTPKMILMDPRAETVAGGCFTGIAVEWAIVRLATLHPFIPTFLLMALLVGTLVILYRAATRSFRLERETWLRAIGVGIGLVAFGYLSAEGLRKLTTVHALSALGIWMVIGAFFAYRLQANQKEEGTDGQEEV